MKEWGIDRAALGIVLSMELFGMALGSVALGGVADKIGRRPTVLGCLVVMALGMYMVTTSNGVLGSLVTPVFGLFGKELDPRLADLSVWRIITGLGIGGMLAAINAVAAELNRRRLSLTVAIMSIGYPSAAARAGSSRRRTCRSSHGAPCFTSARPSRWCSSRSCFSSCPSPFTGSRASKCGRPREDQPHACGSGFHRGGAPTITPKSASVRSGHLPRGRYPSP
jgi:hypothetical protein